VVRRGGLVPTQCIDNTQVIHTTKYQNYEKYQKNLSKSHFLSHGSFQRWENVTALALLLRG
jgi:hypothetical protein